MSSEEIAISVRGVTKHYVMFQRPEDRLKQMIIPRLQRLAGRQPTRYFRDFAALSNVSFDIGRGETVGIVGRNGSGKSTLLQIICGTLQPTAGTVEVKGRIAALLELGAGFNPEFTGRENVYLNATIQGLSREEIDSRFDSIADFAGIGQFIEEPVKTYSSGMYVRLAFATAINVDPEILVVDEALAVGDEAFQRKCFARIEDIKEKGGTILFVSHSMPSVVQLCDRALLVDGGEVILDGRPKMVASNYQRLVNASRQAAVEIRAALKAQCYAERQVDIPSEENASDPSRELDLLADATVALQVTSALAPGARSGIDYEPALVSTTTAAYEERGARISAAKLLNMADEQVNILQMGRRYIFEYHVDFQSEIRNVGCGMAIRSVTGLGIAGLQTSRSTTQRLSKAEKGSRLRVRIEFLCSLLPATYFCDCGVVGIVDGEPVVAHRIKDVLMFRVKEETELIAWGLVDLGAFVTIEKSGFAMSEPRPAVPVER